MRSIIRLILLLAITAYCNTLQAQDEITSKQYNEAYKLAEAAKKQLLAGNVRAADSLIRHSINIYTTLPVFDYAIALGSMPDVVGANLIMDLAAERVRTQPGYKDDPMATNAYVKDKNLRKLAKVPYDTQRKLFYVYKQTYNVNVIIGERKRILASLAKMLEPVIKPYGPDRKFIDIEIDEQRIMKASLANYQYHFDEAIKLTEEIPLSNFFTAQLKEQAIKNINLARYYANPSPENNAKAAAMLKDVPGDENAYFSLLATTGQNNEARIVYEKFPPSIKNDVSTQYYLGVMDITDGNFASALARLKKVADGYRNFSQYEQQNTVINRFLLYKAFGDAYAGLKQYDKAKDNYKLSILDNSNYTLAAEALTKLEVKLAEASAVDKTPPAITLLEPVADKSAKLVVAENTVMIKGLANDISGIKEVSVNGKSIYTQRSGDFWGEVSLTNGTNIINIIATDMAGNKATKSFTIVRQAAAASSTAIIPVENREGQNYCLLIAAQNYSDSSIPTLEHPIADAIKLKLVLKSYYDFADKNIITLFNPQTADFRRQLLELTNTIQPEDNLVIFYAGHGIWVEKEKKGYWLMTDAVRSDVNTWLPNKEVLDMIAKLPARHTLLITDACFSGSVFKSRGINPNMPAAVKEMGNKISRVAITSGNDTEVPDESVFMKYLVKALNDNKEKYLTAQKMFINNIIEAVMNETKTEPRYGTLESAGHIGGDFIFARKN